MERFDRGNDGGRRRDGLHLCEMEGEKDFQGLADADIIVDYEYLSNLVSHCRGKYNEYCSCPSFEY